MTRSFKTLLISLLIVAAFTGVANCFMTYGYFKTPPTASSSSEPAPVAGTPAPTSPAAPVRAMFSWEDEPYRTPDRAEFYTVLEALEINTVYQSFIDENLYGDDTQSFLTQAARMGTQVYYTTGAAEWGLDPNARAIIKQINKVAAYNKAHSRQGTFSGILLDVEPYLSDQWDEDKDQVMESYVAAMTKAYGVAEAKGIPVILCIPTWYDAVNDAALEALVQNACDSLLVMNYNRADELGSISREVELAQAAGKPVICAFEFQAPGKHDLTDNETYYNAGLDAGLASFQTLEQALGYDRLGFAYHYYKAVAELYNKDVA